MTLDYLDFDYSEDADGTGTFDAMASVQPAQLVHLQAEVERVLAWAYAGFPGECQPLEDGGTWQYDLRGSQETSALLALEFDAETSRLAATPGPAGPSRTTVCLTLSGSADFCTAFRDVFSID